MTVLLIYWLPILLEQQGVPIGTAIVTTSILNGAGILGGIVLAFLADRVGAPRVIVVASFAASLAVVLLGFAAPHLPARSEERRVGEKCVTPRSTRGEPVDK